MKPNQRPQSGLVLGILAVALSVWLTGCRSASNVSHSPAVQVDLHQLLNDRVIITQQAGQLQLANNSVDHETGSFLITQSAMEITRAGQLNPLPDSGFFAADTNHPDVQLPYGVVGSGFQVRRSPALTETYSFRVPKKHYAQMQLFFISADGSTPISVTLEYADGSAEQRSTVVPDFYWLLKPTDTNWFVLADDFGKVNRQGKMTESVHHFIHGFSLNPDPAKVLRQVEVAKLDSKSALNLFGATGTLKTH